MPTENAYLTDSAHSDAELSTFICAYITAENMLSTARLQAGETVLVTGSSGGVGTALIQLAHARGAKVIALTSKAKENSVRLLEPHGWCFEMRAIWWKRFTS